MERGRRSVDDTGTKLAILVPRRPPADASRAEYEDEPTLHWAGKTPSVPPPAADTLPLPLDPVPRTPSAGTSVWEGEECGATAMLARQSRAPESGNRLLLVAAWLGFACAVATTAAWVFELIQRNAVARLG